MSMDLIIHSFLQPNVSPYSVPMKIGANVYQKLFWRKYYHLQGTSLYTWAPGGGGGTQIWFRRGCAAEAAKPIPIFKGHFGGKGYLLLRVFSQENAVFVYFSDEMGENI